MSSHLTPFTLTLLLQLYCFAPGISCLENPMEQHPEVESKWETPSSIGQLVEGVDNGNGVDFDGDTISTSPMVSKLIVTCSAHYPIEWTYKLMSDLTSLPNYYQQISVTSLRTSEDFHDPKTYKFYAYLQLRGPSNKITGEYKCCSFANETLSVSRYIFWKGSESKSLLLGELPFFPPQDDDSYSRWPTTILPYTTNLWLGQPPQSVKADKENQTIIIPCATSYPSATINLYKRKDDLQTSSFQEIEWRNETANAGISFDPRIGFTIQVQELLFSPYGTYKCKSGKEADTLIVKVAEGLQSPETPNRAVNNTLIVPAKFSYDGKTQTIVCCSNGARAPRIYSSPCKRADDTSSFSQNCEHIKMKLKGFLLFNRGAMEHRNCRQFTITDSEGMFRCFGPGIDITRQYYIPPSNSTLIYFDDEIPKVPKEDLIQISPTQGDIYYGYLNTTSILQCHPAASMFSYGVRWSILWKNGTTELFPEMPTSSNNRLQFTQDKDMTAGICHAPLSKSWEWLDKRIQFNITEPVAPVISGPDVQEYTVSASSLPFSFTCKVERGNPPPVIKWVHYYHRYLWHPCSFSDESPPSYYRRQKQQYLYNL